MSIRDLYFTCYQTRQYFRTIWGHLAICYRFTRRFQKYFKCNWMPMRLQFYTENQMSGVICSRAVLQAHCYSG